MKKEYIIAALIIITLVIIFWLAMCQPVPPNPTPTPTKVVPTKTFTPTPTKEVVVVTETVEPTFTPTSTLEPTKTPTPTEFVLLVHTGYENGWLHYRTGPSKSYTPKWYTEIGAVQENTKLGFLDCPNVSYPWVHVVYKGYKGYVYGTYLNTNPCSK
jgi:hypothetical protein